MSTIDLDTYKLWVGNLDPSTTSQHLYEIFSKYGVVVEAVVMTNKEFGFVVSRLLKKKNFLQSPLARDYSILFSYSKEVFVFCNQFTFYVIWFIENKNVKTIFVFLL